MITIKDRRNELSASVGVGDALMLSDGLYMIAQTADGKVALLNLETGELTKAYDTTWELVLQEIESGAEQVDLTMTLTNWREEK